MALRHFKDYYYKVCKQREDMIEAIKDIEKELSQGMATPEQVDKINKMAEPVFNTYKSLSWVMYLLNKPNRDKKVRAYEKRTKKVLNSLDTNFSPDSVVSKNNEAIRNIKRNDL